VNLRFLLCPDGQSICNYLLDTLNELIARAGDPVSPPLFIRRGPVFKKFTPVFAAQTDAAFFGVFFRRQHSGKTSFSLDPPPRVNRSSAIRIAIVP
jgi:hypothetical protein